MNPLNSATDLNWLFTALATFLGSFGTWFFTRRQYRAQARQIELDTVEKAIGIWRSLAVDLKKEVAELKSYVKELEAKIDEYENMVVDLRAKLNNHLNTKLDATK